MTPLASARGRLRQLGRLWAKEGAEGIAWRLRKRVARTLVPPGSVELPIGVVMMTSTACAVPPGAAGLTAAIRPSDKTSNCAAWPPNFTAVALVKPEPSTVTRSPASASRLASASVISSARTALVSMFFRDA